MVKHREVASPEIWGAQRQLRRSAPIVLCRAMHHVYPHLSAVHIHGKIINFDAYERRYGWVAEVSATHRQKLLSLCNTALLGNPRSHGCRAGSTLDRTVLDAVWEQWSKHPLMKPGLHRPGPGIVGSKFCPAGRLTRRPSAAESLKHQHLARQRATCMRR